MAIKREDLLKFSKSVDLAVTQIEDDSSEENEVKILHLANDVTAVGSLTTPEGKEMRLKGNKVYIGADNIDEFLKDCIEKDGQLIYKGGMHLDVSKPSGRLVRGTFTMTKPAKIWLTKIKFSRFGGQSRQAQTKSLTDMVNTMFSGGVVELASEVNTVATKPVGDTGAGDDAGKVDGKSGPEVVPNKAKQGAK